jgi:hypothetical protein
VVSNYSDDLSNDLEGEVVFLANNLGVLVVIKRSLAAKGSS